jgi:peroxiredoxin
MLSKDGEIMSRERLLLSCAVCLFLLPAIAGCGNSPSSEDGSNAGSPQLGSGSTQFDLQQEYGGAGGLPAASIPAKQTSKQQTSDVEQLEQGSPEWLIREIALLRVRPAPDTDDPARLRSHRRWKNERIIEQAQEAITLTHADTAQEDLFNTAVGHLLESRLELALQAGAVQSESERKHVEELYDDAESLFRRDPKSKAAAEAAFVRARFANVSADRFAAEEPRWLIEFSRQARLFAENFPQEKERAVQLLDAAGRSCELHHIRDEAVNCYTLLDKNFPKTPQGQQATAVLRRLRLDGERLESFAGPTIDGGYTRIDDFHGRIVIIAFWASHSRQSVEQLPGLLSLAAKWGKSRVAILGVNLDDDQAAAKRFIEANAIQQPTIFWPDKNRRNWKNPIVQYYGVRDIPMFWLIDSDGLVVNTLLNSDELENEVGRLLNRK